MMSAHAAPAGRGPTAVAAPGTTCGVYREGDVPPVAVRLAGLTGALVHVAAQLRAGLVARAGRAHAQEAARRVAALPARAQLQYRSLVTQCH